MEGIQRNGTSGNMNVGEAFLLVFGGFLTIRDGEGGWDRVAFIVEEVEGAMGDGGVVDLEEGVADGVADLVAFSVNSLDVKGEAGSKGIKDGSRRDGFNMRANGGKWRQKQSVGQLS